MTGDKIRTSSKRDGRKTPVGSQLHHHCRTHCTVVHTALSYTLHCRTHCTVVHTTLSYTLHCRTHCTACSAPLTRPTRYTHAKWGERNCSSFETAAGGLHLRSSRLTVNATGLCSEDKPLAADEAFGNLWRP